MDSLQAAHVQLQKAGISTDLNLKWLSLTQQLESYSAVAVTCSGGVDSCLLSYIAAMVLGEQMTAVTIQSTVEPAGQVDLAADLARKNGFKHIIIPLDPLQNPRFQSNPIDRCYHCKTDIMRTIREYARQNNIPVVLEGQNADDQSDYRPGARAVAEAGVFSPLAENRLTKAEIRWLAKAFGLSVWNLPSSPCLASRFPYGIPITQQGLQRTSDAEIFLHQKGFSVLRVRYYQELARIEVLPEQFGQLLEMRTDITTYFKTLGFHYVSLDLEGYRMGSLNEGLSL